MKNKGFTLVEIIIAVGLFALVMVLVSGAYLTMINSTRHTQGITAGINSLSFALETMARTIRTGTSYGCPVAGTDCSGGTTFSVRAPSGSTVSYSNGSGVIMQTTNGVAAPLTDSSINVTSLQFYAVGTQPGDTQQARVTIKISGTVSSGPDKTIPFAVETSATMRGSDI